jgi:hypothetical protein
LFIRLDWFVLSTIIFSFPFSRSLIFSSQISGRTVYSRKYFLGFRENREIKSLSLSLSLCLYVRLSISLSVCTSVCMSFYLSFVCPSIRLSLFLFFFCFFSRLVLSFICKVGHFSISQNLRQERELFIVPKKRWQEVFGNCFPKILGTAKTGPKNYDA